MPIFKCEPHGPVAGIYGRRISDDEPKHLYLPGPHRGVWNAVAAKNHQTLFITEAILDGMSLWQAGHRNVIALYGANGWTDDHERLLKENGATEIYLCLDNDDAGKEATAKIGKKMMKEAYRIASHHIKKSLQTNRYIVKECKYQKRNKPLCFFPVIQIYPDSNLKKERSYLQNCTQILE